MALIKILYRSRRSVGERPKTIEVASNLAELHALRCLAATFAVSTAARE